MTSRVPPLLLALPLLVSACAPPSSESPLPVACQVDADCAVPDRCAGTARCVSNQCLRLSPLPDGECCGTDLAGTCRAGACVDLGQGCWTEPVPAPEAPEPPAGGCPSDRVVVDGVCRLPTCGDGVVDPGEACDDGNDADDDGCKRDCAFTCLHHGDCDDGDACNGEERCAVDHTCLSLPAPADGTLCETPFGTCQAGVCEASVCGDGQVDTRTGEVCDDGNLVDGDGCDADCSWSCNTDADCEDGQLCNGQGWCHIDTHTCQGGRPASDGTVCDAAGAELCLDGTCVPDVCGNGFVNPATEACDDGNREDGDGCDADCTWSCESDAECDDGVWCSGAEFCDADHVCRSGVPVPDGALCGAEAVCRDGACVPYFCGDGRPDPGEACDDGNSAAGDGCEPDCTWTCASDADCDDGNACNGAEFCHPATRTCLPGAAPDCDDGEACTVDSCHPTLGCLHHGRDADRDGVSCRYDCNDGDSSLGEAPLWATDCDGDGFAPADAEVMAACTRPTIGRCAWVPYRPEALDCADGEPRAHPAQIHFFTVPYLVDGTHWSFDYDCNGRDQRRYPSQMKGCSDDCYGGGWKWVPPTCGQSGEWRACKDGWFSCGEALIEVTQSCR